jgi:urease accessory protein
MTTTTEGLAVDRLLWWLSPSFPVGAFSYSHGLETAVETGEVGDRASLERWVDALLRHGGGWSDAVILAHAHRHAEAREDRQLAEVAELAAALAPSRERRLETTAQGEAFRTAVEAAWPRATFARLESASIGPLAYPVAVAVAAAAHGVSLGRVMPAYLQAFAANLISAAVRLVPLGQSDGLRVLAGLEPVIAEVGAEASTADLGDVGGCAIRSDIMSMRHETLHTRLFRS